MSSIEVLLNMMSTHSNACVGGDDLREECFFPIRAHLALFRIKSTNW
jgi:hypothetical protein